MESWGTAPDWVRETAERCLHDLQQPSVVDLRLEWSEDDATLLLSELEPDGGGGGFSFSHSEPGAQNMVAFAHFLQDQVFWESLGAWAEARPACCRGHRHPATPNVLDGDPCWTCPQTGQRLSLIGSYEYPLTRRERRKARRR
jgi:hypothetical protein